MATSHIFEQLCRHFYACFSIKGNFCIPKGLIFIFGGVLGPLAHMKKRSHHLRIFWKVFHSQGSHVKNKRNTILKKITHVNHITCGKEDAHIYFHKFPILPLEQHQYLHFGDKHIVV